MGLLLSHIMAATFIWLLGLLLVLSEAVDFPQWCVVPSALHVLQNETCSTLQNYSSNTLEFYAMRGEQEDKQLLLDLRSLPTQFNLTSAFAITFSTLKLADRGDDVTPAGERVMESATVDAESFD